MAGGRQSPAGSGDRAQGDALGRQNPYLGWDEPPDDDNLDEFIATGVKAVHFEALDDCRWYANIENEIAIRERRRRTWALQ